VGSVCGCGEASGVGAESGTCWPNRGSQRHQLRKEGAHCRKHHITLPWVEDNHSILVRPGPSQAAGVLLRWGCWACRLQGA
jgi:hypothetical protein